MELLQPLAVQSSSHVQQLAAPYEVLCPLIIFSCGAAAHLGLSRLILKISRSYTIRHTHTHNINPIALLWTRDQLVLKAATYTTHNQYKRRTSMSSVGFEPTIPAIEWPQIDALDRTNAGIGCTASFLKAAI